MANEQIKEELTTALHEQYCNGECNHSLNYYSDKADFIVRNIPLEFVKSYLRAHNHAKHMTKKLNDMMRALK